MAKAKESTPPATSSAHAPGPWQERYDANTPSVVDADGTFICHVYPMGDRGRGRANARLIAASTDLLEACEAALLRDDVAEGELGDLLRSAVAKAQDQSVPPCAKCGVQPLSHASAAKYCDDCENVRVAEIFSVLEHHERHPDECCCDTYLGRHCCESPTHGGWWRVDGLDDGERFCFFIRASSRKEALEIGTETCLSNGEECVGVAKVESKSA